MNQYFKKDFSGLRYRQLPTSFLPTWTLLSLSLSLPPSLPPSLPSSFPPSLPHSIHIFFTQHKTRTLVSTTKGTHHLSGELQLASDLDFYIHGVCIPTLYIPRGCYSDAHINNAVKTCNKIIDFCTNCHIIHNVVKLFHG